MSVTTCRHIKTNGKRCQSPTLGSSAFCYFHSRLHRRHKHLLETSSPLVQTTSDPAAPTPGAAPSLPEYAHHPIELDLPPVEDAESIQVSISLLIAALARNRIDPKRAAILLYALQLASTNAKSITIEPYASSVTRTVTRTRSGRDLAAPENDSDRRDSTPDAVKTAPQPAETTAFVPNNENIGPS
jgi:hypothetical protein